MVKSECHISPVSSERNHDIVGAGYGFLHFLKYGFIVITLFIARHLIYKLTRSRTGKEPGDLSGGQKQRVALASVLALQPRIIILDEATSMLDPVGRHEILKLLQKLRQTNQMTIISITHDPDEIELTDETIVVDQSQIKVQGPSQKVLHQASLLQEIGVGLTTGERLRQLLAKRGVDIPDRYFTLKEIEQWIVQQLQ